MNMLSWLIYVADIMPRVGAVAIIFGVIGSVAGLVSFIVGSSPWTKYSWHDNEQWSSIMELRSTFRSLGKTALIISPVLLALGVLSPNRATIYMVAASEAGEAVVTSEDGREMLRDLRSIIQDRLREALGDEAPQASDEI